MTDDNKASNPPSRLELVPVTFESLQAIADASSGEGEDALDTSDAPQPSHKEIAAMIEATYGVKAPPFVGDEPGQE